MSASLVKNLVVATIAGVAGMLIYDAVKKRMAAASSPTTPTNETRVTFPGGITIEQPAGPISYQI